MTCSIDIDKRVAIFLPSSRGGGAERSMISVANHFAKEGFNVDIAFVNAQGAFLKYVDPSVNVVDFQKSRTVYCLTKLIRYLFFAKPRVLICVMEHLSVVAIIAKAICRSRSKVIVSVRNTITERSVKQRWASRDRIKRWIFQRADGYIAVSESAKDAFSATYGIEANDIKVIYNPLDLSEIDCLAEQVPRHPWARNKDLPIVLGVGRLTPQKDFLSLVKAFSLVREQIKCRLVILGEGEQRQEIESAIKFFGLQDDVLLPGFVDPPYSWMKNSDVFVLSSAWEGLPGVLLQAMACGTPVVATDCPGGNAEILQNGKWGSLVPVGDHAALAQEIVNIIENGSCKMPRSRAMDFCADAVMAQYKRLLGSV